MNLTPLHRARAGFTLIEVVVSAAMITLVLVTAYLCLNSVLSSQRLVESRAETIQGARVALNLLSADLRSACPLSKQIEFLGRHQMLAEREADQVDFATHFYRARRTGEGDFCQTSYFLAPARQPGRLSLWRRRNPIIGLDPLSGGTREEIIPGVREFRLEYYDGLDWYDDWGDPTGRAQAQSSWRERPNLAGLPEAVRITLWVEPAGRSGAGTSRSRSIDEPPFMVQTVARLNLSRTTWTGDSDSNSSSAAGDRNPSDATPPNTGGP